MLHHIAIKNSFKISRRGRAVQLVRETDLVAEDHGAASEQAPLRPLRPTSAGRLLEHASSDHLES